MANPYPTAVVQDNLAAIAAQRDTAKITISKASVQHIKLEGSSQSIDMPLPSRAVLKLELNLHQQDITSRILRSTFGDKVSSEVTNGGTLSFNLQLPADKMDDKAVRAYFFDTIAKQDPTLLAAKIAVDPGLMTGMCMRDVEDSNFALDPQHCSPKADTQQQR